MDNQVGLMKHFAACVYELLSLIAIWLLCTTVFIALFGNIETGLERFGLQVLLWIVTGTYVVTCWVTTGQTLAAQAWKIKLVSGQGQSLTISQAMIRYVLATLSLICFCLGFLWAFVDKKQLFLHDRILKTRLIKVDESKR
jgi:uncharacterized RDD family membrane protein YckC